MQSVLLNYYDYQRSLNNKRSTLQYNSNKQLALPVLRLLTQYGAYPDTSERTYFFIQEDGSFVEDTYIPLSPLYHALNAELPLTVIELLLESGADPEDLTGSGKWPSLQYALEEVENIRLARLLVEYGANINRLFGEDNNMSYLIGAASSGKISSVPC